MALDHGKLRQTKAGARTVVGWKCKAGTSRVLILPPASAYLDNWEEMTNLAIQYKLHFYKIEGRKGEAHRCLEDVKQRCPCCDTWRMHRKADDPGLAEMAKQISPSDQYLFNMMDVDHMEKGIQRWAANWTCWDGIMEIASNPAWGNVVDPASAVIFVINLTLKGESKSGYNSYSVSPEPQRVTVMDNLAAIENWKNVLDELPNHVSEPKAGAEMVTLLDEMGFPQQGTKWRSPKKADPPEAVPETAEEAVAAVAPTATAPAPIAPAAAAPAPVAPAAAAPAPVAPAAAAPIAPATAAPVAATSAPPAAAPAEVHYDPGPDFTPPTLDKPAPPGAPRCFGVYDPAVHRCTPCPQMAECQIVMLGAG